MEKRLERRQGEGSGESIEPWVLLRNLKETASLWEEVGKRLQGRERLWVKDSDHQASLLQVTNAPPLLLIEKTPRWQGQEGRGGGVRHR